MKEFWNQRYAEKEFAYGTKPNEFFAEKLTQFKPGRILLPADGEGRNSVFAALQSWEVDAFDYSEEGKQKADALAKEKGVSVHFEVLDAAMFKPESDKYDVIGLFYAHFPRELRKWFHKEVIKSLKKGGIVILEAFHPLQLNHPSGGPRIEDMLLTVDILKDEFEGLEFLEIRDEEIKLDEGNYHLGTGHVVRMIAIK
jgi:SAM-dependent methyltransferase